MSVQLILMITLKTTVLCLENDTASTLYTCMRRAIQQEHYH